jgi:hypothetical protein
MKDKNSLVVLAATREDSVGLKYSCKVKEEHNEAVSEKQQRVNCIVGLY